jgi:hypothetical protein
VHRVDALLKRIRARVAEGQPCDHSGQWLPAQPPIAPTEVAEAEAMLGFRLPELLRLLYTEIGNGGFGPEFGLIPLSTASLGGDPPAQAEFELVGEYARLVSRFTGGSRGLWPTGLVPAFYCGCTVFEFVDCKDPAGPVVWFDEGTEELAELLNRKAVPSLACRLEAWLEGKQVW